MMNTTVRRGTVVLLLMLSASCGSAGPTADIEIGQPYLRPPPTPAPPNLPPLSGPSRTFTFVRELAYAVRDFTNQSRFVLYDNGAFVLRYPGIFDYRGAYRNANGVLAFDFGGGTRDATGSVNGDSLTVRFTEMMQHSDFEDAVYVLMR